MTDEPTFKPYKISFTLEEAEEAEQFLRGLIVARSNNSSPIFPTLIDAVNQGLEKYRAALIQHQVAARDAALAGEQP
jgi:hypothetical protein